MKKMLLVLALSPLLGSCNLPFLNGCESNYQAPDFAKLDAELSSAKSKWSAANIQNYTFVYDRFAAPSGFPDQKVVVRGGKVDNPVASTGWTLQTMDDLLADVASSISDAKANKCRAVKATYDATDGHLLTWYSGILTKGIQDGFGSVTVKSFQRD